MEEAIDVVVIGGGVIGLAIAWRTAKQGLSVAVIDDARAGAASAVAAGMLAPATEAYYGEEQLLELSLASRARYPQFVTELEHDSELSVAYSSAGTLVVARDADDNAVLDELYRFQRSLGLPVERLRRTECRKLEPALAPSVRGGVLASGDHHVDNRAMIAALAAACRRRGVSIVEGAGEAVVRDGRVRGARAAGREVAAEAVVVAAGCWTAAVEGIPAQALPPVRPVKGQLIHLQGAPLLSRVVRGLDVYLVPRSHGRVVVGATLEEKGFDATPTAGAVYEQLRDASELVPGIAELELVDVLVGLRPGTPDNAPLVGATSVAGLFLATGHYRNGFLLAPVTAGAMADLLVTGEAPEWIAPFSPQRFTAAEVAG